MKVINIVLDVVYYFTFFVAVVLALLIIMRLLPMKLWYNIKLDMVVKRWFMVILMFVVGCGPAVVETRQEQVKVDKTKEYEMILRQDFEEFLDKARTIQKEVQP